jgi:RNA polymerase sigma-70 factor (ECF subfamily)
VLTEVTAAGDPAAEAERAASVSLAMLVVLETLSPLERTVFVLHEAFAYSYGEIGEIVDRSPAAVRQLAHRAREHVAARRPRMTVSRTEQQQVVDRFLAALAGGDVQGLMDVLAPDVVVIADSGGLAPAALRPVSGQWRVANAFSRFARFAPRVEITTPLVNGTVGARIDPGGEFDTALTFVVEDGRITRMYAMRNPHKLAGLDGEAALTRG